MNWPWEKPCHHLEYVKFMDTHIRVRVSVNKAIVGYYAVVDEGVPIEDVFTSLPNGTTLSIEVSTHPKTTDPRTTATELIKYILETYK